MQGLTSSEAAERLKKFGPNTIPEEKIHPFFLFLKKFWDPVPWMLELTILLELALKKWVEASVIGALLLFNAFLSFFQESRANRAFFLLKEKLTIQSRVLRDDTWQLVPAKNLVPGDIIRIRMGDVIPADVEIFEGNILVDPSALTGESVPLEMGAGKEGYAGSTVKRGEAFAKVTRTGKSTYFGHTAELVEKAEAPSHLQKILFQIIKYLIIFDLILIGGVLVFSVSIRLPLTEILPFSLLLLIASVPVALPATYTLATALGSIELAKHGVLVRRLPAIEEAATMTVLCIDKTGTITQNRLEVVDIVPFAPFSQGDVLVLGRMACEQATQDPIDLAIIKAASQVESRFSAVEKKEFIPFDPENKYSEAIFNFEGKEWHVKKGAPHTLVKEETLSSRGVRVIAVTAEGQPVGLIGLQDPPREDSSKALEEIQNLGIQIVMLTGDSPGTAAAIASQVGMNPRVISREDLLKKSGKEILEYNVIADVFPDDKIHLITLLQKEGRVCGMTGDGVNDAPALKKAEVGIAVSNATDVAKASASIVLTNPGLRDILEAIKMSRKIYQRMLTYIFNKIVKTIVISILLGLGLIFMGHLIITPLLIVLLLFANDFVTMSIATDNVSFSIKPDRWDIRKLISIGLFFGTVLLGFSFTVLLWGEKNLSTQQIPTLVFLTLVFTGQATVYLVRERGYFWHSMPSYWMIFSSVIDIVVISWMATLGILMTPLSLKCVLSLLALVVVFFVGLDFLKVLLTRDQKR